MKISSLKTLLIPPVIIAALVVSCSSTSSLQNINKDWNRTIRAAHVYPIDPLTQDLQPGDIFFSPTSIEDTSAWDENSGKWVPLDHLIIRLYPSNYANFYEHSFGVGTDGSDLPKYWISNSVATNTWSNAPVAAFPGYTFSIQQGAALNVALPIQGIPVALGLMGAKNASGTVTISDAHTYGVDELSLLNQVTDYLNNKTNANSLLDMIPEPKEKPKQNKEKNYFLNVVSRVFTAGQVAVSVYNESSVGGGVSAGSVNTSLSQFTGTNFSGTNSGSDYSNLVSAVNGIGNSGITNVGGALKFTSLSGRSVSMNETFPKPVIIGYIAFSVAVTYEKIYKIATGKTYDYNQKTAEDTRAAVGAPPESSEKKSRFMVVPFNPINRNSSQQ